MSLGDNKSSIMKDIFSRAKNNSSKPLNVVECGSYAGYSTLLFGSILGEEDTLHSVEIVPEFSEVSKKEIGHIIGGIIFREIRNVLYYPMRFSTN